MSIKVIRIVLAEILMLTRFRNLFVMFLVVSFAMGASITCAAVLRVPEDYATIQDAVTVAVAGDIVSVASGTYYENVSFVSHDVALLSRTMHGATINGGGSGHVVACNPYRATVEGFIITGSGSGFYGGIFTSQASQVIRDNIITGNNHGIVASSTSDVSIYNNQIIDNGSWGAGIRIMTDATGTITNNHIAGNRYGIYSVTTGEVVISNNTITGNTAWNMYFTETAATITNNIVTGAEYGILFGGGYDPDITGYVSRFLNVSYNNVWNHSTEDYFAELGGIPDFISGVFEPLPGTSEIHLDPLLSKTVGYELLPGSPCIDAGDNNGVPAFIVSDITGNPRFADDPATIDTGSGTPPIVDIGAYEYPDPTLKIPSISFPGIFILILLLNLVMYGVSCHHSHGYLHPNGGTRF